MLFSPFTFRLKGQPSDPETSPPVSARYAGDTTLRLVAQTGWAARRGPAVAGLFRAAFLRTQRAPFRCTGLSGDWRTSSAVSAFCIAHTSWLLKVRHLCPFALWSGSPGLQIGRALLLRLLRALCRHRARAP